ncbi:MAG: ribonuclease BN, partial [Methylovulum sp.]
HFSRFNKPLSAAEIATKLLVPIAVIQPILLKLIASHIIVEFKNQDDVDEVYLPAVDINILTTAYVINALEQCGQNHLPDLNQERLFMNAINNFRKLMEASEHNRLLKDIYRE